MRAWTDRAVRYIFGRDFFISYARRDAAAYAAALANALGTTHSCYLDQLATPRGPELPAPIRKEVGRATTFVLVGSQAAVESHYVGDEIRHFLETGRPILLLDVGAGLASAQWDGAPWSQLNGVYRQPESAEALRDGRPSEATVAYVRGSFAFTKHDRRLRRASMAAAVLLSAAIGVGTLVSTVATRRAADAGRRAESARADEARSRTRADAESQRASEAGNRAAAAQQQEAEARRRADEQERIATSRRLANESASRLDSDPELAMLLAAHSFDAAPTVEARRALLSCLSRYPGLSRIVRAPTATEPGTFATSANGRVFATGDDRSIEVWNIEPLRRRMRIRAPAKGLTALAVSPDGALLVVAGNDRVTLVDSATGREITRLDEMNVGALAFLNVNRLAVGAGGAVHLWDTTQPSRPVSLGTLLSLDDGVTVIAPDPADAVLAVASLHEVVTCSLLSCAATAERLTSKTEAAGYLGLALALRADVPVLATTDLSGRLTIWELKSRQRLVDLSLVNDLNLVAARSGALLDLSRDFYDVALGPGASFVVVGSAEGRLMVGSLDDLTRLSEFIQLGAQKPEFRKAEEFYQASYPGMRPDVRRVVYAPGASHVAVTGDGRMIVAQSDGGVSLWDPTSSSTFEFARPWLEGHQAGAPHAVSADGHHVLDQTRKGTIRLSDVTSGTPLVETVYPSAEVLAVSAEADLVAAVDTAGSPASWRTLVVWDASGRTRLRAQIDRRIAASVQPRTFPAQLIIGGPPGEHLVGLVLADGTAAAWAVDSKASHLLGVRNGADRIAVNPRGGELAVANRDGVVSIWEPGSGAVSRLPVSAGRIMAMSYSSDGRALAAVTIGREGVAFVRWDLEARRAPSTWKFSDHQVSESGIAISGDLGALAVGRQSAVDIWDTEAQSLVVSRVVPGIESLTFDLDGGLVAGRLDGVTYIELNPKRLASYVCGITARTLTSEESQRYFGAPSTMSRCSRQSP